MTRIDRVEAHRRLHAYYDALEASEDDNDPDCDAVLKDTAFAAGMALIKGAMGDLLAERYASARLVRHYLKPSAPWGDAAKKAASSPVARAAPVMDQDEAAEQRWVVARLIGDFADILMGNLARNFQAAMLSLNLGVQTALTKPLRVQGLKGAAAPLATLHFFEAMLVYFLAGYRGISIEEVLRAEVELFDGLGCDTLKSHVRRLGIALTVAAAKDAGAADKAAGRPEEPEYIGCKDLRALRNVTTSK